MTQFVIVISPAILISIISLVGTCVKSIARYKELKLLRDTGVEHGVVTDDQILF